MGTNNVTFKGNYGYNYNLYQPKVMYSQEQTLEEDEQKSNAAKYMIGATALAGTIALLGVAAYKGKLGKAAQELVKGSEKAVGENVEKGARKAGQGIGKKLKDVNIPKTLEYKIVKDQGACSRFFGMFSPFKYKGVYKIKIPSGIQDIFKISAEEFEKLERINIGGSDCRILAKYKNGKPRLVIAEGRGYVEEFDKITGFPVRSYENVINDDGTVRLRMIIEYDKNVFRRETKNIYVNSKGEIDDIIQYTKFDENGEHVASFRYEPDGKTKLYGYESGSYGLDDGTELGWNTTTSFLKGKKHSEITVYSDGSRYEETFFPGGKRTQKYKDINADGSYTETYYYKNGGRKREIVVDNEGEVTSDQSFKKVRFRNLKRFINRLLS